MALRVGRVKKSSARPKQGRMPLNYYRSGPAEKGSSPFVKKTVRIGKKRKYIIRILDIVVIIILLYVLGYSLLVKANPKVVVNDTTYHSHANYQAAATKQLSSLKNRNKITLNERGIVDALKKQFPELDNVRVELPLLSETPTIHLSVAKPSFFLASHGANYIIDSQGVATAKAASLPKIKDLTTLTDDSGFSAKLGQQVLSAQNVTFINSVLQQATHANVPVKSLTLPSQAEELDLRTTDHGYYVKFYLGGDPILQSGQFLAARHQFDQSGHQPAQYLDVRVNGKIFYK